MGSGASRAPARLATVARHVSTASSLGDKIVVDSKGATRTFTLNRPSALNAIDADMFAELSRCADAWRSDPSVRAVIGQGQGRAFAAGGDIKVVVESGRTGNPRAGLEFMANSYRMNWKFFTMGKPYVSIMDGLTMGGGAGLALIGDIRIATPRTVFAMPEQRIGFSPDAGASYFLTQLDGYIGTWLAITGQDVYGRAAFELGVATHYVAEESIPKITEGIAALSEPTLDQMSAVVDQYHLPGNEEPSSAQNPDGRSVITGDIRSFLDETFSLPSLSAIYRRLEAAETDPALKREVQQWASEQRRMMDQRGPTGMAVVISHYALASAAKRYATTIDYDLLLGAGFLGHQRATEDLLVGAVHSLFDKKKTLPPFNPPITALDDTRLQPQKIRDCFLTRENLPEALEGELQPPPQEKQGPDGRWGEFRKYGIPSEEAVRKAARGCGCRDVEELVGRIVGEGVKGVRRGDFEAAVRRIAAERLVQDGSQLRWRS